MGEQFKIPAADAPAEEWGRLAVSIPGWRWMPGMAIGGEVSPRHRRVGDHWHMRSAMLDPRREYAWPDPDDPATAGCLLALLGEDVWRISKGFTHNDWRAVVRDACEPWQEPETGGLPLGRACIAAAAALGRWPGVDHG